MENRISTVSSSNPFSQSQVLQQSLIAFALLAVAFAVYTRHNDFPFSYHPDERTKVQQVPEGTRNYHHLLLFLTATNWLTRIAREDINCQRIVTLGRDRSAALFDQGFQRDHRRELVEWIGRNVAADAIIVEDDRVRIPAEPLAGEATNACELPRLAQKVRIALFAADLGSLEELRAAGVTYVAVAEGRYDVFSRKDAPPCAEKKSCLSVDKNFTAGFSQKAGLSGRVKRAKWER